MAVSGIIPGGSVLLIPAVAVSSCVIHATEMEGGAGGVDGDLSPSAGGLIPGGVTVLKNTRGVVARIQGRASCSRDDSRWCSVTSNTRKGSSNPGGELVVPGMIPGGIASRPIPGRVVRTLGGELVVPGVIPGGVASMILFVYTRSPSLFITGGA